MKKVLIALNKAKRDTFIKNEQLEKDTGLSIDDLNDAVELLEKKSLVEWLQCYGTMPFKFDSVQLTALGRSMIKQEL
jgi:DNA-binding MarR family transcriptional regulator